VLWPEIVGKRNDGVTIVSDTRFKNEFIATKIRWFVVVKMGHDCCSCLYAFPSRYMPPLRSWSDFMHRPILTYGRQACAKPQVVKWQHAIIYTGRDEPAAQPGEQPKQGEYSMMLAIRVSPKSRMEKLDPLSRINFGKIYTVEHNVKVYDFGDVHPDSLVTLKAQWKYTLKRNLDRELEEEDSEDGDTYAASKVPAVGWATTPTAKSAGVSTGNYAYPAGVATGTYVYPPGVVTGNYAYPSQGVSSAADYNTKGKTAASSSTGKRDLKQYAPVEEEDDDDDDDDEDDDADG
jgi:hypothetical protein